MNEETTTPSQYWLELAADEIIAKIPDGVITVSSGISPSANYHIGHFREILTAEALAWAVRQRGRPVDHIHVVDNFDPLRKRYDFLPEWLEEFVGQPICLVPSPDKSEDITYADHFFNEFIRRAEEMGIHPTVVVKSYEDLYSTGRMTQAITDTLGKLDVIKEIFARVSNRQLEADWAPVQVLNAAGRFEQGIPSTWDEAAQKINGVSYTDGKVKLNWRLDWPARWRELGVQVEPFSIQEHGAAGSSYDTGAAFSEQIFGYSAPLPGARYGNIHLLGDTKKMSSSKGNLITPKEALEIMPAEVLRYFVVRSRAEKTIYFDTGLGILNLMNEYAETEAAVRRGESPEFADAYKFAADLSEDKQLVAGVSFGQLVIAYQTARGDWDRVLAILEQFGWVPTDTDEAAVLKRELEYVAHWLERYAPEAVKFNVSESLPNIEVSESLAVYLDKLVAVLQDVAWTGDELQNHIFQTAKDLDIQPKAAFQLLYQLFINKDAGPKLGPFLATLDREFVLARLQRER